MGTHVQAATYATYALVPVLGTASSARTSYAQGGTPEPEDKDSKPRWPVDLKRKWAAAISSKFSEEQDAHVKATGQVPHQDAVPGLKDVYKTLRTLTNQHLDREAVTTGQRRQVSAETMRTAFNRATVKLVRTGSVLPSPPHKPGYKDAEREGPLRIIRDALGAGFSNRHGTFYYANVKEGMARSETIQAAALEIGLKTPQALWALLKRTHPELYIGKMNLKKPRDHALTQVRTTTLLAQL